MKEAEVLYVCVCVDRRKKNLMRNIIIILCLCANGWPCENKKKTPAKKHERKARAHTKFNTSKVWRTICSSSSDGRREIKSNYLIAFKFDFFFLYIFTWSFSSPGFPESHWWAYTNFSHIDKTPIYFLYMLKYMFFHYFLLNYMYTDIYMYINHYLFDIHCVVDGFTPLAMTASRRRDCVCVRESRWKFS